MKIKPEFSELVDTYIKICKIEYLNQTDSKASKLGIDVGKQFSISGSLENQV